MGLQNIGGYREQLIYVLDAKYLLAMRIIDETKLSICCHVRQLKDDGVDDRGFDSSQTLSNTISKNIFLGKNAGVMAAKEDSKRAYSCYLAGMETA